MRNIHRERAGIGVPGHRARRSDAWSMSRLWTGSCSGSTKPPRRRVVCWLTGTLSRAYPPLPF